jgi:uncharacterized protein YbjT (DUF2867 family)
MTKHDERTILVTGSTGTVGSEVVKQLASPSVGYGIIKAAVHSYDKSYKFKGYDSVEIVNLDYRRQETSTRVLKNVDKIFLLTLPALDMTDICSNLLKEAKKNDVKYIVKLSVMLMLLNTLQAESRYYLHNLQRIMLKLSNKKPPVVDLRG